MTDENAPTIPSPGGRIQDESLLKRADRQFNLILDIADLPAQWLLRNMQLFRGLRFKSAIGGSSGLDHLRTMISERMMETSFLSQRCLAV
jgi:hypothetical protein